MLSDEKMKDFSTKEKVCISAQVQPTTGMPIALTHYTKPRARGGDETKNYLAEYSKFSKIRQSLKQPPMQVFNSIFKQAKVNNTVGSGAMMRGNALFINNQCEDRVKVLFLQQ